MCYIATLLAAASTPEMGVKTKKRGFPARVNKLYEVVAGVGLIGTGQPALEFLMPEKKVKKIEEYKW
jgi:hypothetical protein